MALLVSLATPPRGYATGFRNPIRSEQIALFPCPSLALLPSPRADPGHCICQNGNLKAEVGITTRKQALGSPQKYRYENESVHLHIGTFGVDEIFE